jgi:hypothetical protein
MRIEFHGTYIEVFREKGDKAFYGVQNAAGESNLLYAIKKKLNSQGYDLIKKRMWKDGHLVDDMQQYLRTRKATGDPAKDIYIVNGQWAIQGAEINYNAGSCCLNLHTDIFAGGGGAV